MFTDRFIRRIRRLTSPQHASASPTSQPSGRRLSVKADAVSGEAFARCFRERHEDANGLILLALSAIAVGRPAEALAPAARAHELEPDGECTTLLLAVVLTRTRRSQTACSLLAEHIRQHGLSAATGLVLAQAHAVLGSDEAAERYMEQVLELEYTKAMDARTSRIVRFVGGPIAEIEQLLHQALRDGSWDPLLRQARRTLAAGEIGRITSVYVRLFRYLHQPEAGVSAGATMALALRDLLAAGLPGVAALAEPHFILHRHGPLAGLHLLKAFGTDEAARRLLQSLHALEIPALQPYLAHHAKRLAAPLDPQTSSVQAEVEAIDILRILHSLWWEPLRQPAWLVDVATGPVVAILPLACPMAREVARISALAIVLQEFCRGSLGADARLLVPLLGARCIADIEIPWHNDEIVAIAGGAYGLFDVVVHGSVMASAGDWEITIVARMADGSTRTAADRVAAGDYDGLCRVAPGLLAEVLGRRLTGTANPAVPPAGHGANGLLALRRCLERLLIDAGIISPVSGADPLAALLNCGRWPFAELMTAAMVSIMPTNMLHRHSAPLAARLIDTPDSAVRGLWPLLGRPLGKELEADAGRAADPAYQTWLARVAASNSDDFLVLDDPFSARDCDLVPVQAQP